MFYFDALLKFINTNNDLITKTEAYETFAYKSDMVLQNNRSETR